MSIQIVEKLTSLQLYGFISALNEQLQSTAYNELSFQERLALLVEQEVLRRKSVTVSRKLKSAALRQQATIEQIEFKAARGIKKAYILELAEGNWVREHHNLIITGATGVGKSFMACAIGDRFCKIGFNVKYVKAPAFINELLVARSDGSFKKTLKSLKNVDVLVLDEWIRDPLTHLQAREIFDLLDDRYRIASCVFVSQIPVSDWYKNISDPTLAEAILDRVIHDSLRLEIKGESMRKCTSKIVACDVSEQVKQGGTSLRSDNSL